MSTNDTNNEWIKRGNLREEWDTETDYGVVIEPGEWDDYADEQAVPVPSPPAARAMYEREQEAAAEQDEVAQPSETPDEDAESDVAVNQEDTDVAEPAEEPPAREEGEAQENPLEAEALTEVVAVEEAPEEPAVEEAPEEATAVIDEVVDEPVEEETPRPRPLPTVGTAEATYAAAAGAAGLAALYRKEEEPTEIVEEAEEDAEETSVSESAFVYDLQRTQIYDQRLADEKAAEEERLAKLQQQRDARDARLGVVSGGQEEDVRVVQVEGKRQSDKFFGAFSLLVLRLVTAAIIGILGYQVLSDIDAAHEFLATTVIPEPRLVAWILGYGLLSMAVLLVVGLGVRVVGFLLLAVSAASLATIRWGAFSVFQPGLEGFLGDRTLLTAAVSLVLLSFGSGRVGIDGAIRSARDKSKAEHDE